MIASAWDSTSVPFDREVISDRPEFAAPFQPEMLSVFLTRAYTLDLVEHMAFAGGEVVTFSLNEIEAMGKRVARVWTGALPRRLEKPRAGWPPTACPVPRSGTADPERRRGP